MKPYIMVLNVEAEPCTFGEWFTKAGQDFPGEGDPDEPGYLVINSTDPDCVEELWVTERYFNKFYSPAEYH